MIGLGMEIFTHALEGGMFLNSQSVCGPELSTRRREPHKQEEPTDYLTR
jgi:hypothetical protein